MQGIFILTQVAKIRAFILGLGKGYQALQVQKEYLGIIKNRINHSTNELLKSDQIPSWLKFFCYSENIKEKDYIHLIDSLDITF